MPKRIAELTRPGLDPNVPEISAMVESDDAKRVTYYIMRRRVMAARNLSRIHQRRMVIRSEEGKSLISFSTARAQQRGLFLSARQPFAAKRFIGKFLLWYSMTHCPCMSRIMISEPANMHAVLIYRDLPVPFYKNDALTVSSSRCQQGSIAYMYICISCYVCFLRKVDFLHVVGEES